ncbi:MAG: MotA/TolQ/ExbB proton channel family protein [Aureliella sp.]
MFEEFNSAVVRVLYSFSNVLLFPVLLAIIAMAATVLLWIGGFMREALERRRVRNGLRMGLSALHQERTDPQAVWEILCAIRSGLPREFTRHHPAPPSTSQAIDLALSELESNVADRLARCHFVTRTGPMLGLLGTLIPLGPALVGLSAGNIQTLSINLVTAFATTVAGLFCGCMAYGMGLARSSWYSRDLDHLEHIVRSLAKRNH